MRCDSVCCMCGKVWKSRWLMMQLTNGHHVCVLVFVPMVDILNIPCDCQFVFCVFDELYVFHTTVTWSGKMVVLYVLRIYWCDLDLIQGQSQGHWPSESPKIALFYVYLLRYFGVALTTVLMGDYGSMGASLQLFGARFLNVFLSWRSRDFEFAKCWYRQNSLPLISALAEAISLWLWLRIGRNKPWIWYDMIWYDGLY